MKTLFFGAGPLGIFYAQRFHVAGLDVKLLARGNKYHLLRNGEVGLKHGFSGEFERSQTEIVGNLLPADQYDLVVVLVRQNKIPPVLEVLSQAPHLKHILFMGNNVLGFDSYLRNLPREKVLFGFPGAGGGWRENTIEYIDCDKPGGRKIPVRIGEMDGIERERTAAIRALFEASSIRVNTVNDIDGWLKYHAAFVIPIANAIDRHDNNLEALAQDRDTLKTTVLACREAGNVLRELGYRQRQPFKFNLFYWLPEVLTIRILRSLFESEYARVAFALHAGAARDEFESLTDQFLSLAAQAHMEMPNFVSLRSFDGNEPIQGRQANQGSGDDRSDAGSES